MAKLQTSVITDTLELCNASGEVIDTISYTLNVATTYSDMHSLRKELAEASKTSDKQLIGNIYIKLLCLFFGKENADKIIEFYGENEKYETMILDLSHMMIHDIFPAYNEYGARLVEIRKALKK